MMSKENIIMLQYKFEHGVYSLKEIANLVEWNQITEEDFHTITSYNFKGIIKNKKNELI